MPKTIPFKASLPKFELAHQIVIDGANQYDSDEIDSILAVNPNSFLQVIHTEHNEKEKTDPNSIERFKKIHLAYHQFKDKNLFHQEIDDAYYIYVQENSEHTFKGIVCAVSCLDYRENHVKKHEDTLTKRELMFADYLSTCKFNAEPVLLTYPNQAPIDEFTEQYTNSHPPYFSFKDEHQTVHSIWKISIQHEINLIRDSFEALDSFYIADGHHRFASSNRVSEMPEYALNNEAQYCLSYLIPESNLKIYEFNRILKLENEISESELVKQLSLNFFIEETKNQSSMIQDMEIVMYCFQKWYRLVPRNSILEKLKMVDEKINTDIISNYILDPIFNIKDLKNDDRVKFMSGRTPIEKQIKYIDEGNAQILLSSNPISVSVIKQVADNGLTMPPKSTWIEPKLKTGLFVYEF